MIATRLVLAALVLTGSSIAQEAAKTRVQALPPNILFLFADDLGWTDVSTGAPNGGNASDYYRTPRIARLATRGMSFDNAYTCGPNCAPTRAALMSGQYGPRTGIYTVGNPNRGKARFRKLDAAPNETVLAKRVVTMAETLKQAGYATGHFGKWHLGNDADGVGPLGQGFDVNIGGTQRGSPSGGSRGHFAKADGSFKLPGLPANGKPRQYVADRLTDEALVFLKKQKAQPFFLYMAHFAVHTPIQATKADKAAFDAVPPGERHQNQTYAAMLKNLDDNIGRLLDYLETTPDPRAPGQSLIKNTMVIFYSDNGGVGGYRDAGIEGGLEVTHQHPLKAGKGSLYEGGIRVPLIVRFDGRVEAGSVSHVPVITVDFYPTLAAIAGAALPKNQVLDGTSFHPILTGKKTALQRRSLFWHFPAYLQASGRKGTWRTTPRSVIRKDRFKLHFLYETRTFELYDLTNLSEGFNLAENNPAKVRELAQELRHWLADTKAALPRDKNTGKAVELPPVPAK